MTEERKGYERPQDVRDTDHERADGRPTGQPEDGLRPGQAPETAPTEPVEEHGGEPTTEHAPGGDL